MNRIVYWKIAKATAIQQLLRDGSITNEDVSRGFTLQKVCRLLGLRTTDGRLIKGRQRCKYTIVAWFNTGHRKIILPERFDLDIGKPICNPSVTDISQAAKLVVINHRKNPRWKFVLSKRFYSSREWLELRHGALLKAKGRCALCGSSAAEGIVLHVDHIKPRSLYPWLALKDNNLQVLCHDCNLGKSNLDETDWRTPEQPQMSVPRIKLRLVK